MRSYEHFPDGSKGYQQLHDESQERLDRIEKLLGIFDQSRCEHARRKMVYDRLGSDMAIIMKETSICADCGKELG